MRNKQKQTKINAIIAECYAILYNAANTAELFKLPTVKAWGDKSATDDDTRLAQAEAMLDELKANIVA